MTNEQKIEDLESRLKAMFEKKTELFKLEEEFKALQKSYFGITDGEQTNVLGVIKAMLAVKTSE